MYKLLFNYDLSTHIFEAWSGGDTYILPLSLRLKGESFRFGYWQLYSKFLLLSMLKDKIRTFLS